MDRFTKTKRGFLDSKTGLIWKSKDELGKFTYSEAMQFNGDVWRLPNIEELVTIIDYRLHNPSTLLPHIKASGYWSASPYSNYLDGAQFVYFGNGYSGYYYGGDYLYVRLVRSEGGEEE